MQKHPVRMLHFSLSSASALGLDTQPPGSKFSLGLTSFGWVAYCLLTWAHFRFLTNSSRSLHRHLRIPQPTTCTSPFWHTVISLIHRSLGWSFIAAVDDHSALLQTLQKLATGICILDWLDTFLCHGRCSGFPEKSSAGLQRASAQSSVESVYISMLC